MCGHKCKHVSIVVLRSDTELWRRPQPKTVAIDEPRPADVGYPTITLTDWKLYTGKPQQTPFSFIFSIIPEPNTQDASLVEQTMVQASSCSTCLLFVYKPCRTQQKQQTHCPPKMGVDPKPLNSMLVSTSEPRHLQRQNWYHRQQKGSQRAI